MENNLSVLNGTHCDCHETIVPHDALQGGSRRPTSISFYAIKCTINITVVGAGNRNGTALQYPCAGFARMHRLEGSLSELKSDPAKWWPTDCTEAESQEMHHKVIQGTQIFGFIAVLGQLFAYICPRLK